MKIEFILENQDEFKPLPEKVANAFYMNIADAQRGLPERAMLRITRKYTGVFSVMLEHIGDLSHRATQLAQIFPTGKMGWGAVVEKVNRGINYLTHPYGFAKEAAENLRNDAKYLEYDLEEYKKQLDKWLDIYVYEHMKLPSYNEVQFYCKMAAVYLGKRQYDDCLTCLRRLRHYLSDKSLWMVKASEYRLDEEGRLIEYPYDH